MQLTRGTETETPKDVSVRGVRLRFVEAGAGAPIILLHGFLASHTTWNDVIAPFAERFRVVAIDLPGFGDSEKPPPARYPYTPQAFAESIVDLIAALDLNRAAVIGQRMGAIVALTMAAAYPDVVDRLVLVSPDVYGRRRSTWERAAVAPVVGGLLFKQIAGRRLFVRSFDGWARGGGTMEPRMADWFDAFSVPAAREAAHATLSAMTDIQALLARIGRVDLPVLVCGGGKDDTGRLTQVRRLAHELPAGRLEVFDTGRAPEEERPDEFVRKVSSFLLEPRRS